MAVFFGEIGCLLLTGLRSHVFGESRVAVYYLTGLRSHVFVCLLFNR